MFHISIRRVLFFLSLFIVVALVLLDKNVLAMEISDDLTWTIIDQSNAGQYLNEEINQLVTEGKKNIYIKNGAYNLNDSINIRVPDVIIKGESKENTKIVQTNIQAASINVAYTSNVTITDLTINNATNGVNAAVISTSNVNNVSLKNCIVYGNDFSPAIYFGGKSHTYGNDSYIAVENNDLDLNNTIENNSVYSNCSSDGIVFYMQSGGIVKGNTLKGSRMSLCLSRNLQVANNIITDSITNGIRFQLPGNDSLISDNTIENSTMSGISVVRNKDIATSENYRGKNFTISNNTINNTRYMGLEVSNMESSIISNNNISISDFNGIYLIYSDALNIKQNSINSSGYTSSREKTWDWNSSLNSGILADYMVKGCNIDDNIIDNPINNCVYGIRIQPMGENVQNSVKNNSIKNYFSYPISLSEQENENSGNIIDEQWTVIDQSNAGQYLNNTINEMISNGKTKFLIKNGTYNLNSSIHISKPNVILKGESKELTKLIQVTSNGDTIGVDHTSNVTISDLTISNKENGNTAVAFGNVNKCVLKNCIIYGSDTCFAIFFAGPDHIPGADMLAKVENNNLDDNNVIEDCTVYSNFNGDGVAFCGQKNGIVRNNNVTGSRIVMYLCRNSQVVDNTIKDSVNNGIDCAVPAYDNIISGNTIENSKAAGIWVVRNGEHPVPISYRAKNVTISNNVIKNSRYMGISIENLADSTIINNTIDTTDFDGIYMLYSDNLNVKQNNINNSGYTSVRSKEWEWNENFNSAIMLEYMVKNCVIDANIIDNPTNNCVYGIRVQPSSENTQNSIINNVIKSNFINPTSFTGEEKEVYNNVIK